MLVNFTGAQIGGYTLLEEIGRGGMSRVYRASRPDTGQHVAVKVVNSLTTRDTKFEQRFWREIAVINRLNHPGILPVLSSGQEADGTLFMVMPLVEGGTLKDYLAQHPTLTPGDVFHLASQIGEALDYAHGQGIVHRDVKPHNIMLLAEGRLCLADFGVAALASVEDTVSNLTSTGATMGTFAYISPEQIRGGDIDGRADLYSLGIVLYQTLVGRLPFGGENTALLLSQHLHSQPIPPHEVSPGFPQEVEAVLDKALAKNADERYQTGAELARALDAAFTALPESVLAGPLVSEEQLLQTRHLSNVALAAPTAQEQPDPRRLTRRMVLAGLALLALLVVLCGVVVMPLQARLAEAQGTAAALGSRTPVIVTQVVTNEAGQTVIILVTAVPGASTALPTPTALPASTQARTPTGAPTPSRAPIVTLPVGTPGGNGTGGDDGGGAGGTSAPTDPGSGPTPGGGGSTSTPPGGGTPGGGGGNSGTPPGGGNSGGGNSGGGNSGGGNPGGGNPKPTKKPPKK